MRRRPPQSRSKESSKVSSTKKPSLSWEDRQSIPWELMTETYHSEVGQSRITSRPAIASGTELRKNPELSVRVWILSTPCAEILA